MVHNVNHWCVLSCNVNYARCATDTGRCKKHSNITKVFNEKLAFRHQSLQLVNF